MAGNGNCCAPSQTSVGCLERKRGQAAGPCLCLVSGEVKFRFSLVRFCDFQACNFSILEIVSFPKFSLKLRGTIPGKMARFHWARKMQNRNAEIRNLAPSDSSSGASRGPRGRAKQVLKLAFQPRNGAFFELKKAFFCRPCLCPNATKQSILAKIHFFTRSHSLEARALSSDERRLCACYRAEVRPMAHRLACPVLHSQSRLFCPAHKHHIRKEHRRVQNHQSRRRCCNHHISS